MGRIAHMTVKNDTKQTVTLMIRGSHCMYDGGGDNVDKSNLSAFNGTQVAPGQMFPGDGAGEIIEAKSSSSDGDECSTEDSTFSLLIEGESAPIGTVNVTERFNQYNVSTTNDSIISATVTNGGDYDIINVVLFTFSEADDMD